MKIIKLVILVSLLFLGLFSIVQIFAPSLKDNIKQKMAKDFQSKLLPELLQPSPDTQKVKFTFEVISDIHNDSDLLKQSINKMNQSGSDFVVGLGDYTNTGTEKEFANVYAEFANLNKKTFFVPGDHDLWNGRDKTDDPLSFYRKQFGEIPEFVVHKDITFIFINNADLYQGISEVEQGKVGSNIAAAKTSTIVIISHKPIYHPLTIHRMGYVGEKRVEPVLNQADELIKNITLLDNKKVYMIHGDLHSSSTFKGPTDNTTNFTVGALTRQKNFQSPRYAVFSVYESGAIKMKDELIDIAQ